MVESESQKLASRCKRMRLVVYCCQEEVEFRWMVCRLEWGIEVKPVVCVQGLGLGLLAERDGDGDGGVQQSIVH